MVQGMQTGTPMGMLSQNNPQLQQVYDYIRTTGGNAKSSFYLLAKQKGADPDQIINQAMNILGNKR